MPYKEYGSARAGRRAKPVHGDGAHFGAVEDEGAISATSMAGGGYYSAYVGAIVDLARIMEASIRLPTSTSRRSRRQRARSWGCG